jgi:PmbA protein
MPEHEIYSVRSESARLVFSGGELKVKESDSGTGFGVRILENGKLGFSYCQSEEKLHAAIGEARRLSGFSVKSGFSFTPKSPSRALDISDETLSNPDFEMLKNYVEDTRRAVESKGGKARIISSIESAEVKIENSAGFSGAYHKTVFSIYAECMHGDGFGHSYLTSHHPPPDLHEFGLKAAEMALSMQGAGKPDTGNYTIVMQPEALDSLLETLIPSFSGDWKRRGMTKLSVGGRLHESLTIGEDGIASEGINARPFDDEGTPSQRRFLVENGEVKSFLYDRETAALEGIDAGGSCSRQSYDSAPSIGASNLVISSGSWKDLNELGRFIEVHDAHGSHTANLTSGDIGFEVSGAFLVEKGNRKPVKGFLLSGNVFDMFSNIEGIEQKQHVFGSLIAPRIAFRDVKVVS